MLPTGPEAVWPSFRYDAANTAHAPELSGPADPDERWTVEDVGNLGAFAALGGQRAFGGVGTDGDGEVVAHDREGGDEAWEEDVDGQSAPFPVLGDDGLYAGGEDAIHALGFDGEEQWESDFGGEWSNVQAVVDDTVVATGSDDESVTVAALDAGDGDEVWARSGEGTSVVTAVADGTVFTVVPGSGETIEVRAHALDDGDVEWRHELSGRHVWDVPVTDGDRVYVSIRSAGDLVALDADDGDEEWRVTEAIFPPAVTDDGLLISDGEGLAEVDPDDGSENWQTPIEDGPLLAPVVGSERIYAGSHDPARLYAFDRDGDEEWQYESDALWTYSPVLADGVAYFGTYDPGRLIALGAE